MANTGSLVALIVLSCLVAPSYGVLFTSLQKTLIVTASPTAGQVLKGGKDNITLTWSLNTTMGTGIDSEYHTVKLSLCYAPVSQKDRGWRKTKDDLEKDKTCPHKIVERPYTASDNSFTWTVAKDVPTATYFVRAYVLNSKKEQVAFGQTTNPAKETNLFDVNAVSGRHASLDIASICFSCFSIVSLAGFFYMEKRSGKASSQQK